MASALAVLALAGCGDDDGPASSGVADGASDAAADAAAAADEYIAAVAAGDGAAVCELMTAEFIAEEEEGCEGLEIDPTDQAGAAAVTETSIVEESETEVTFEFTFVGEEGAEDVETTEIGFVLEDGAWKADEIDFS